MREVRVRAGEFVMTSRYVGRAMLRDMRQERCYADL